MITIESYILLPEYKITDLKAIDTSKFINVKNHELLLDKNLDYDYIEGAITINYKGKNILDFKHWDLVDQLWLYFMDAIKNLKTNTNVSFLFPDQPLKIVLEKINTYLSIYIGNSNYQVNFINFINSMISSAHDFFINLISIFPDEKEEIMEEINYINEIKKSYISF